MKLVYLLSARLNWIDTPSWKDTRRNAAGLDAFGSAYCGPGPPGRLRYKNTILKSVCQRVEFHLRSAGH